MTTASTADEVSDFTPPVAAAVNHLLRQASWARVRLQPFNGKTARFECAPFKITLTVLDAGEVRDATTAAAADVTFTLTPGVALRMLAADPNGWREVRVNGDAGFAQEVFYLVQHLRWDIAEDLSQLFGDIAAQRIVDIGKTLHQWGKQTADNLAQSFAEYWTEERPLIASRDDLERFYREVDRLRDDVARIEKRIELLSRRKTIKN